MASSGLLTGVTAFTVGAGSELLFGGHGFSSRCAVALRSRKCRRRRGIAVRASDSGTSDDNMFPDFSDDFNDVDANMLSLRRRIEGLRIKETCSYVESPEEWMDWEKSCYSAYRADVNVVVASLQSYLLNMRPSVALSIFSLLVVVIPVAGLFLLYSVGSQAYSLANGLMDVIFSSRTVTSSS